MSQIYIVSSQFPSLLPKLLALPAQYHIMLRVRSKIPFVVCGVIHHQIQRQQQQTPPLWVLSAMSRLRRHHSIVFAYAHVVVCISFSKCECVL